MSTRELMNIGVSGLIQTVSTIHWPPSSFGRDGREELVDSGVDQQIL